MTSKEKYNYRFTEKDTDIPCCVCIYGCDLGSSIHCDKHLSRVSKKKTCNLACPPKLGG